ncbi:sigma-70 family RNA polymerase sigma factor [Arthrobacter sp. ISL-48]|nr:sigma-70 family RNA polymerase sigma factor [Arthrobacter sp. ISL-48]
MNTERLPDTIARHGGQTPRPRRTGPSPGHEVPPPTEAELLAGVRSGDPEAMAVLYERHRDEALRFAASLTSRRQDAEDVLHEAFAKTVSAIRRGYGPSGNFGAYLSTCVRSVAASVWTKQMRERPALVEELEPDPVDDPGLERVLSVLEREDVVEAMRALPARWQTVLWYAEVMGEPPRNIARMLDIEPNAVSALLIRARAGLRAAYNSRPSRTSLTGAAMTASEATGAGRGRMPANELEELTS